MQHDRDERVQFLGGLGVDLAQCPYLRLRAIEPALLLERRYRHRDRRELVQAQRPVPACPSGRCLPKAAQTCSGMAGRSCSVPQPLFDPRFVILPERPPVVVVRYASVLVRPRMMDRMARHGEAFGVPYQISNPTDSPARVRMAIGRPAIGCAIRSRALGGYRESTCSVRRLDR